MNSPNFFVFLSIIVATVALLLPMSSAYGSELVVDTFQDDGRIVANINLGNYTGYLALASFWLGFNPDVVEYEGYNRTLDGYEYIIMDDSLDSGLIKIVIQHVDPPLLSNPELIRVNFKGADASAAEIDIKKVELIKDFYGSTIYETKEGISSNQTYTPSSQELDDQKVPAEKYVNAPNYGNISNSDKNKTLEYDETFKESTTMDNKESDTINAPERTEPTDRFKSAKPYGKVFLLLCGSIAFCFVLFYILRIKKKY